MSNSQLIQNTFKADANEVRNSRNSVNDMINMRAYMHECLKQENARNYGEDSATFKSKSTSLVNATRVYFALRPLLINRYKA